MVKAKLELPNGTKVEIEGSPDEVEWLLGLYEGGINKLSAKKSPQKKKSAVKQKQSETPQSDQLDITDIVNLVKSCDEAEDIETRVLDKISQVDRTLLPLYIVHEHMGNEI